MHRSMRMAAGILALSLAAGGCYGPFNLTRRLYRWNGDIQGKWEKEFVFLLLAVTYIYSLAGLGDAIVFNSMEFWTGNNPVDPPDRKTGALPQTKRIVRGDAEVRLTRDRKELRIEQFQRGVPSSVLRLRRESHGTTALNQDGAVLFTSETLADGSVLVQDAEGRRLAKYSRDEAERFLASLPQ